MSVKCTCGKPDCLGEIDIDHSGCLIIHMNDAPSLHVDKPDFLFYLDANQTIKLIKLLKDLLTDMVNS